jgi:hypothetical protein
MRTSATSDPTNFHRALQPSLRDVNITRRSRHILFSSRRGMLRPLFETGARGTWQTLRPVARQCRYGLKEGRDANTTPPPCSCLCFESP